jgi:hypothetical protein
MLTGTRPSANWAICSRLPSSKTSKSSLVSPVMMRPTLSYTVTVTVTASVRALKRGVWAAGDTEKDTATHATAATHTTKSVLSAVRFSIRRRQCMCASALVVGGQ